MAIAGYYYYTTTRAEQQHQHLHMQLERRGCGRYIDRTRSGERIEGGGGGRVMEMSSWQDQLGVVDTIYEDDHEEDEEEEEEEDCFNSPSLSSSAATSASCSPAAAAAARSSASSSSSLPPVLRHAVQEWSRANGSCCKPDVIVHVQEHCFPLHRDPITSQSSYLKRQLSETSEIAVDLPAGLTTDGFVDAVASCYGVDVALSPGSLAAVWVAADWLELNAEDGLARRAEDYFFQEVATDCGRAASVLRSCLGFLGGEAAPAAASLLVRCLETLASSCGADGGMWLEDVAALPLGEFQVAVEAMRARFAHDHDLMYTIVDHYLENHKGKLTEEEKSRLCYNVNCGKLSHHLFMHLVQNPRLPLRFVVQAMLVEQLHSHHSMLLGNHHNAVAPVSTGPLPSAAVKRSSIPGVFSSAVAAAAAAGDAAGMTLGDILQRDAALRQSAHIRASMRATGHRIDTLERELAGLRCRLRRSEQAAAAATASAAIDRVSAKSASFRITRNRLWDGEDLASGGSTTTTTTTGRAAAKGIKSRLVLGFKTLFGRRAGNGAAATPACSDDATVRADKKGAYACSQPELEADASEELGKEEWSRTHRRNLSIA